VKVEWRDIVMANSSRSTNAARSRERIGWVEKLRRFVDGDDYDIDAVLNDAIQPKLRARDLFYKQLAHQIDEVLNREAFSGPNVPLTVPDQIVIRVASDINANWLNQYRRRLLEGLDVAVKQRIQDMAGPMANRTPPPQITLVEDVTLDVGDVRVEPGRTAAVGPRADNIDPDATQVYLEPSEDEPTIVITPQSPLYELEIFRSGEFERRIPISRMKATIGRGSKSQPADVSLNAPDVSRIHAALDYDSTGPWVTALGQNATRVGGNLLERRHRRKINRGEYIEICQFSLRFVPSERERRYTAPSI